jgi:cell division protease FtsH
MDKKHKISIWYVLLGIWFVLLLQQSIVSMFAVKVIPYSEFLKSLKEGRVVEVAISANRIQGKMKSETDDTESLFRTVRVDANTSELLEKHNIVFKGEIESNILGTLLSWVIPTAIFSNRPSKRPSASSSSMNWTPWSKPADLR